MKTKKGNKQIHPDMLPYMQISKQQEMLEKAKLFEEKNEDESSCEEIDDYHINGYHPVHIK